MKKILSVMLLLAALLALSCANPAAEEDPPPPSGNTDGASLANTVFAGEDAEAKWVTIAFIDGEKAYYFPDNAAHYNWRYTYDGLGNGSIIKLGEGDAPSPGAFTLSADGMAMTFSAYLEQGERSFKRTRGPDGEDDEVPFTYGALTGDLDGTVWAATAYRTKDWTTLTITAESADAGEIQVSHSFDCTSFPRKYTGYAYNTQTTLAYIGPFIINGDNFTFLNFYGHGAQITLKRMR